MNESNTASAIASDLRRLGVKYGDTVLVHSSFRSLGFVRGGVETLIRGFLEALGESGTLLVPALSYNLKPPEVFDVRRTAVIVGAVAEYFRTRPGTFRSVHPTHSVCGVGRRVHELLDRHILDSSPCGPRSPFAMITESPAKIIMLGCGLGPNTTMHALEECVDEPRFLGDPLAFTLVNWDGHRIEKSYMTHDFAGYKQRYDRIAELDGADKFVHSGSVLEADVYAIDTVPLKAAVLAKLASDPMFFVDREQG